MQMMDGSKYRGVLSTIDSKEVCLKIASLIFDGRREVKFAKPECVKSVSSSAWRMIEAVDVKIGGADLGPVGAMDDAGGFGTDAAISRGRGGKEGRKLERWAPEPDDQIVGALDDMHAHEGQGWDQFALNEARFGVKTDYKEELYTTELDYTKSKISAAEANRIAREIEKGSSTTTNIHVLEERGVAVDDVDEEARYGAVLSDSQRGAATKSIPINARKETNKVRMHITGSKTNSPYGTPKLESPLVGDVKNLDALNLDPGVPKVDDETRRQFEEFKLKNSQKIDSSGGEEKKKSTLNPNAKSFTFNVNAKEFNPSSFAPAGDEAKKSKKYQIESAPPPPPPPEGMPSARPNFMATHMMMMPQGMGGPGFYQFVPRPPNMYMHNPPYAGAPSPMMMPMVGGPHVPVPETDANKSSRSQRENHKEDH